MVSFLASVFWIALLSFGMVTLVGRTGCILNIDSYVMGLVVIAIGTSIPVRACITQQIHVNIRIFKNEQLWRN